MKKFDLVMVAELFDESMVILADFMCWPLEAVATFKANVFMYFHEFKVVSVRGQVVKQKRKRDLDLNDM